MNNDNILDKNASPQRNMQQFNHHNLTVNRQPNNGQSKHQVYSGMLNTPESLRSQQISNDQSYGSPDSSFISPQQRLNQNRPKGH